MEPLIVIAVSITLWIISIVVLVWIIRWVLGTNEIVSVLNEQTDYLEDIAFRLKRCAEKMGVYDESTEKHNK